MSDDAQVEVPQLPASANSTGQQVSTTGAPTGEVVEGELVASPSPYVDIADRFRGLTSGRSNLRLDPTSMAMMLTVMDIAGGSHRTVITELKELREEHKALQKEFADLRVKHATVWSDLQRERSNNKLRSFMTNLGSAMLGLIPYAADKAYWVGGVVCGIFGFLLLGGWRLITGEREDTQSSSTSNGGQGGKQ